MPNPNASPSNPTQTNKPNPQNPKPAGGTQTPGVDMNNKPGGEGGTPG